MQIIVKIKSVYGNETVYPVCETAQTFAKMLNTKTLTREALRHIKALGYSVQIEAPTL